MATVARKPPRDKAKDSYDAEIEAIILRNRGPIPPRAAWDTQALLDDPTTPLPVRAYLIADRAWCEANVWHDSQGGTEWLQAAKDGISLLSGLIASRGGKLDHGGYRFEARDGGIQIKQL